MKIGIEGPRFRFWCDPRASIDERAAAAHAICRFLIDPPRPVAELRRVAVRTALAQYSGSRYACAEQLAARYQTYLAGAWKREKALEGLPEPRSAERCFLHRIATLNAGRPLRWRQLLRIAGPL
jgi:hypothetical protein